MSVEPTSSLLCYNNHNKPYVKTSDDGLHSTVNTTLIPTQHYFNKNEATCDRRNSSQEIKKNKCLCFLLSIVIFLIVVVIIIVVGGGIMLWIIYNVNVEASEDSTKPMTSQPLYTETLSSEHSSVGITSTKVYRPNMSSQTHMQTSTSTTTSLLTTTSLYTNASDSDSLSTTTTNTQPSIKKVLFIVADGIPADVIENVTLLNIKYIQDIGAYTRAYVGGEKGTYTETATISSPGYMSLLTGTWGNKHNVYDNYVKRPNYHYKNIFRLIKEQQPDKQIGIFSTWTTNRIKLIGEGLLEAGNITFDYKFDGYELDRITYPHDKQSLYIYNIDQRVTHETSECIRMHAPDLSWVYLQYTDDIGHYFGDSQQFHQSITYLDEQIGRIWTAIDYRMKHYNEDWLILITTDHGRDPKNGKHHAGQSIRERTTWIVTNSQQMNTYFHDFQPGIVDILPTIARFMNFTIPIESERELDGIPLIGKVSLIRSDVRLNDNKLNISWTVLDNTGNVTIWLSTSNLFKKGMIDNYTLIEIVSVDQKMVIIDVEKYPSQFYKIVLEGQYNTINKWVYRQGRRNGT